MGNKVFFLLIIFFLLGSVFSASFTNALDAQTNNIQTNVDLLSSLVQYSGIIIIVIVLLSIYLLSRRNVEAGILG